MLTEWLCVSCVVTDFMKFMECLHSEESLQASGEGADPGTEELGRSQVEL